MSFPGFSELTSKILYSSLILRSDEISLSLISFICFNRPSNVLLRTSLCEYSSINLFDKFNFLLEEYATHKTGIYNGNMARTNLGIRKITSFNGVLSKIDLILIAKGIKETMISPAIAR